MTTRHTLDLTELIEIAEDGLTRVITDEECRQYLQGSCPTADSGFVARTWRNPRSAQSGG